MALNLTSPATSRPTILSYTPPRWSERASALDGQLRQLPLQRAPVDPEQARRLGHVPRAVREHALDVLPLDPGERGDGVLDARRRSPLRPLERGEDLVRVRGL